jgi:hypothetical protein
MCLFEITILFSDVIVIKGFEEIFEFYEKGDLKKKGASNSYILGKITTKRAYRQLRKKKSD